MTNKILKAEKRQEVGRKVKNIRKMGFLPGNVYGKKIESEAVKVEIKAFQALFKDVGETGLFNLEIEKNVKPVLIHGVQVNPKTDDLLHVDFLQVDLKEKVTAQVPVELSGESPAEKQGIGTVVQQLNEIEVESLPADIPEKFEVNIENLTDIDQSIFVKDLKTDSKVDIKTDGELIVVKVEPPQKEEVLETTPIVPVGSEGAVPAEGEQSSSEEPQESNKE